ncbi:MAG: Ycf51 family protein [Cyanobacteria bacterium Co-bin13]|nr:Ycf51 family protein [Cyanobacteria bacterium Co-bin13]
MLTPEQFLEITKWAGIGTLTLAAIAALAFVFKWGLRFRLVGATGFAAVLTIGLLGLSFEPFSRTAIPGALPYTTVFDSGAEKIAITVPQTITEPELEATLRQAASNLLKPYRIGSASRVPTIRARTILHDPPGVSQLIYVGQAQPIPNAATGDNLTITLDRQALARLSSIQSSSSDS